MRKTRSDCTVGSFEKKHGLPAGTFRNKDGRDTRSDKKIGTIRKEYEKQKINECVAKLIFTNITNFFVLYRKTIKLYLYIIIYDLFSVGGQITYR